MSTEQEYPFTERQTLIERYRRFAEEEAAGRSPRYEALAKAVCGSEVLLEFLLSLPVAKRQPNLLFAAARLITRDLTSGEELEWLVLSKGDSLRTAMFSRNTQTNEAGRCAVLLPVLALARQPLALLEVGASAGLCMIPDFYSYRYGSHHVPGRRSLPLLVSTASTNTPLPKSVPEVSWRRGIDLNPLNLDDSLDVDWLKTLVWPGQDERVRTLSAAIETARDASVQIDKGDLISDLPASLKDAPPQARPVIFHTAVLAYVQPYAKRLEFVELVRSLGADWVSNESPGVFPEIAAQAPTPPKPGSFLLSVNQRPVAWTDPHGSRIDWIQEPYFGIWP